MSVAEHISFVLLLLVWVVACLGPLACFYYVIYWVVSLPFRWLERARFFLDVLEAGINEGVSAEQTIVALADRHERSMGPELQLLADSIRQGNRLGKALDSIPRLLPPQIVAMLKVGEEIGDIKQVLPAGRKVVEDDIVKTRQTCDGVLATVSATLLVAMGIFALLGTAVFPKMREIALDMEMPPPVLLGLIMEHLQFLLLWQAAVLAVIVAGAFLYLGGPRQVEWLEARFPRVSGWIFHWLPWRYKRLQRDFSFMLATLLDAHVPEEKAVALAGDFTSNGVFKKRVTAVLADLRAGIWLPEAVNHLDDQGEFRWRLANAVYKPVGFILALTGWMEALDARAFQQEQIANSAINVGLLLYTGAVTALIAVGVFQFLTSLISMGAAW